MAMATLKTKVYWIEAIRLVGYDKFNRRNRQSRMFSFFHPGCSKKDAYDRLGEVAKQKSENEPLVISLRQLNKCFGFNGNGVNTVRRAVDEMKILFRNTNADEVKVEMVGLKRGDRRKMVDFETASRIVKYVYANQEIWE